MSLTASLLSSTTPASAAAVSILTALAGASSVFLPSGAITGWRLPEVLGSGLGILPASLVSHVAALYVNSGGRVYLGLGDSFLLERCWWPLGCCNALVGGTEVLLVF